MFNNNPFQRKVGQHPSPAPDINDAGADPQHMAPQLNSPQQSIRGESIDESGRGSGYSHGESRVLRHAAHENDLRLGGIRRERIVRTQALSDAKSGWYSFLTRLQMVCAGEYGRHRDAHVLNHTDHSRGEKADRRRIAKREWVTPRIYYATLALLALADFAFFFKLWSDIEDAKGLLSAASLQAALYALITPVATAITLGALGRVAAHAIRQGAETEPAHRRRLMLIAPIALVLPVVVIFAVRQRISMLEGKAGAAHINATMMMLIFVLLPLGLFVVEMFRQDEDVVLHGLRTTDWATSTNLVEAALAQATFIHATWVAAYLAVQDLISAAIQALREPLNAAGDVLAHEWAMNGANGDYVSDMGTKIQVRIQDVGTEGGWPGVSTLAEDLNSLLAGTTLPIDASEIAAMQATLRESVPPSIESVLERVRATLTSEDATGDPIAFPSATVTELRAANASGSSTDKEASA